MVVARADRGSGSDGETGIAADALERLVERTRAAGTDLAAGIEAGSRALLLDRRPAEAAYREAIDALGRTTMRMLLARAQLVYGEWLRRENRRADSRVPLEAAHEFFTRVGADGFAERAARELQATGATPRKRTDDARSTAHRAGGADRGARPRRPHESRDRRAALPQSAHRGMASAPRLHEARNQLPQAAPAGAGRRGALARTPGSTPGISTGADGARWREPPRRRLNTEAAKESQGGTSK